MKTLFLYFLVYEKLCECQSFLCNENTKKWWHWCSLEYGIGWHWSKKFSNVVQRSNTLLIIVQLRSKLLQPFLVEKELHYDNVIRLCITVFLVWIAFTKCLWRFTNNTENDCSWKLFENNKNISDYLFNQRETLLFGREIFPDMSLCLLS